MKLDHIGYITDQIEDAKNGFLRLGYISESTVDFEAHKCKVCFLRKKGETTVELVEPYVDNKSLRKLLKNGVTPYHVCYEVEDIEHTVKEYSENGYVPLSTPLPAPAFNNRKICYMWSREIGYVEFVEQ